MIEGITRADVVGAQVSDCSPDTLVEGSYVLRATHLAAVGLGAPTRPMQEMYAHSCAPQHFAAQ